MNNRKLIITVILAVLIVAVGFFMVSNLMSSGDDQDDSESVTLPYDTGNHSDNEIKEDSKDDSETDEDSDSKDSTDNGLEISSLYPFSGSNPDCNEEEGEDVAAITVTNKSGKFLKSATIKVTMKDKSEYNFKIEDLPDGKTAQIFDTKNTIYVQKDDDGNEIEIKSIESNPKFGKAEMMKDQVSVKVKDNDTAVKLKNKSDEDLNNLVIYCHTSFEGDYYGGKVYKYSVGTLKAGKTEKVDADDCYMGQAEVVKVTQEK